MQRPEALSQQGTVTLLGPVAWTGALVEPAHLVGGAFHGRAQVRRQPVQRAGADRGGDLQAVQLDPVEAGCELAQRRVAALADRLEDRRYLLPGGVQIDVGSQPVHGGAAVAPQVDDTQPHAGLPIGEGRVEGSRGGRA
ncbi:MAG TPA: hypothetical protein VHF25_01235 [Nitriliruptorales bacterium]|nr:hypothetical protein [Nitriliruptorales bacterium]